MALYTGKKPARPVEGVWMHDYVDTSIIDLSKPPPAKQLGHGDKMPTPRLMLGNGPDNSVRRGFVGCGCCVWAGGVNKKRLAYAISGKGLFPAGGKEAVGAYSEFTGYVIGDDSTDQGTDMQKALGQMHNPGIMGSDGKRHVITAYAAINFTNWNHYLWAVYLDDTGILTGVNFPSSGMDQFNNDEPWHVVPNDSSDGGHCILVDWNWKGESWARDQAIDPAGVWLKKHMDEAYITLDSDGLVGGKSIEGFDAAQLAADVRAKA